MSIWAVIPAKNPALAKSRLAADVEPAFREDLSIQLLEHVIQVVMTTPAVDSCLVVSSSEIPLTLARRYGAVPLRESTNLDTGEESDPVAALPRLESHVDLPRDGLNAAIRQGASAALERGASGLLVVAGDLPLLDTASLSTFLDSIGSRDGLVLAPDRHGHGTNALFVRPPLAVPFVFGPDSFLHHQQLAERYGVDVTLCNLAELALDIDTIDDIRAYADTSRLHGSRYLERNWRYGASDSLSSRLDQIAGLSEAVAGASETVR
jgi:2-phospho-L-lactate guanylyltransferase